MYSRLNAGIVAACALRRFRRDHKGAVAVEFSLIAIPFLMMIFGIIELALSFLAGQELETATQDAARQIMTGQVQIAKKDAGEFKKILCASLVLFKCDDVDVDVRSYTGFGGADVKPPIDEDGNYEKKNNWDPGTAGKIVVVRTAYRWPLFVSNLGLNFGNVDGNSKQLLVATAAFRNEPGPF